MGVRFYDSSIGRWLSEDPVQDKPFDPLTLNVYAYVHNNPLGLVDHDGKVAMLAAAAIGAVIGIGAYALATEGHMTLGGAAASAAAGALVGVGATAAGARIAAGVAADVAATRAAAAIAAQAATTLGRDARLTNIMISLESYFGRTNLKEKEALAFIAQAIEKGIARAGGLGGLNVGRQTFAHVIGPGVRIIVTGTWNGTAFTVYSTILEHTGRPEAYGCHTD